MTGRGAACPQCGKALEAGAAHAKWRPFCSERCKLMDLGDWFAGKFAIPVDPDPDEEPPTPPGDKPS